MLYVNARVHDRFWPTMYSAYTGSRGLARTHEGLGQRDEPAIRAFGAQIEFLQEITMAEVEARSRELATALVEELSALDGVHMWTSPEPSRRAAVVTFRPGELSPGAVVGGAGERRHRGCVARRQRPHRRAPLAPLLQLAHGC